MLIVKLILGLSIVVVTTYIGIKKADKLKQREHILREYIVFINLVEKEMKYTLNVLPEILESARFKLGTILRDVIGNIVVDILQEKDINKSISDNINTLDCLENYDKQIIISTLSNIGKNSIDLDRGLILSSIETAQNQVEEATKIKEKASKMYRVLGAGSGLIIVILFL